MRIGSFPIIAAARLVRDPRALAHEGHGAPAWYDSVLHFLIEPVHLPLTLAVLVALVLASRWVLSKVRQTDGAARRC